MNYITYYGSLSSPPCTEGVQWAIAEQVFSITMSQINAFKIMSGRASNVRRTQESNGRLITQIWYINRFLIESVVHDFLEFLEVNVPISVRVCNLEHSVELLTRVFLSHCFQSFAEFLLSNEPIWILVKHFERDFGFLIQVNESCFLSL